MNQMKLINYEIFHNNGTVRLDLLGGWTLWVSLDEHSGKVVTRPKVGTITNIQHPGIWLGTNFHTGETLIMHNHYKIGAPYISSFHEYSQNQVVSWRNDTCINHPNTVIQVGLNRIISGEPYNLVNNNCQVFTNIACHNRRNSEDVTRWAKNILGVVVVVALIKAAA